MIYFNYIRQEAKLVLQDFFKESNLLKKGVFRQATLNPYLYHLEHFLPDEQKIRTAGKNSKEPNIVFKWIDNQRDVQIYGINIFDVDVKTISSKQIWRFLAGDVENPRNASVYVAAKLFNVLSRTEFLDSNKISLKQNIVEETFSRKDWRYWRNAAKQVSEPRFRVAIYKDGLTELPDQFQLIKNLSVALYEIGNYKEAEKYMLKGIEVAPEDADMYANYGLYLHEYKGDYDRAEDSYKKAYKLNPRHEDNNQHYGYLLHTIREDYENAEIHYRIALEVNPLNEAALLDYGIMRCFNLFDPVGGLELLEKARQLSPNDPTVLGNIALAYTTYEIDLSKAEQYFRTAVAAQPSSFKKQANFAQLLFVLGKTDEAMQCIDIARKYAGKNYDVLLEIDFYLFAHCEVMQNTAKNNLETLLKRGYNNVLKNFSVNIKAAISKKHSDIKSLITLAKKISGLDYENNGDIRLSEIK